MLLDTFMSGKPVETKPSAANMCIIRQWALNRFLLALLIASHSTAVTIQRRAEMGLEGGH